ncbi:galactokinase [Terrimonas alba]|uniref:galactokinase n=1 Tax=Terrimonas alba TaxID=3349636 RepID=UPI0035F48F60
MTKSELQENFRNRFHKDATHFFFCPGRVNLIGEHIDYNGGKVMPCAISRGTFLAIAKNADKKLRFQCLNFPETAELHLQTSYAKTGKEWFNYPLGSINQLLQEEHIISGLDMLFYGNLPIGAGLSSSASIEVLTMFAVKELFQLDVSNIEIAKLGKKVENEFIGLNSGIMDQFAVAMGKKNKAILLNCDSLEYEYLPFEIGDYVLAIINSNKPRTLADSKYNERFRECGAALKLLKQELTVTHLCDIDSGTFHTHKHLIGDAVLEKRALHVVTENERVKEAKNALELNQLDRFGELMYTSHQSLQELYEVSGKELDTIVEFCKTYDGCIGARMTGAGFGGCAIALVRKESFDDFSAGLVSFYSDKIGYEPEVFASVIDDGVKSL